MRSISSIAHNFPNLSIDHSTTFENKVMSHISNPSFFPYNFHERYSSIKDILHSIKREVERDPKCKKGAVKV